ncbi:3'-5' exonuclease [Propionibacterium sp. oral taxon 192]|uniref:3'-5' exonuclease n=1 Tax=Propionibacterium sp. oral taxon 192 TaxID=671222 RepID=UPI0012EC1738
MRTRPNSNETGGMTVGGIHHSTARGRRPALSSPSTADLLAREFVAVDFETANRRGGVSACQVALVKFRDGQLADRLTTFIRPPSGWDDFEFTWLHGISASDTRRAPMWDALASSITAFIGDTPVYAHNASFDARVWRQLDEFFGTASLPPRFFCSLQLSRRMIKGLPDYKLPTVVDRCIPGYRFDHHRADADAEACGLIIAHLQTLPYPGTGRSKGPR